VPGAQAVHTDEPVELAKVDAAQAVHIDAPMVDDWRTAKWPSGQGVQNALPDVLVKKPGGHIWHTAWPVDAVYKPALQSSHVD